MFPVARRAIHTGEEAQVVSAHPNQKERKTPKVHQHMVQSAARRLCPDL